METSTNKVSPALIWTAGTAMILFFAAGTAAFMGWIPGTGGRAGDSAAISMPGQPQAVPASPVSATSPAAPKPVIAKPAAPKPESSAEYYKAPVHVAAAPIAQAACVDCGVIESTHEVDTKGTGSGIGAVGGAVVGGVLGHQVGGGRGKDAATVIGAVGGVLAGNEIEKRMKTTKSYDTTVRMDDGSTRVVHDATAPAWRTGDHVKLVDGVIRSN